MIAPAYLARRAAQCDARTLYVCEEKATTYYYAPRDFGDYFAMCFTIFARRDDRDHVCYPTVAPTSPSALPELAPSDNVAIQQFHAKLRADYARDTKQYDADLDAWRLLTEARAGDKVAAALVLDARCRHEYEGFRPDTLTVPA